MARVTDVAVQPIAGVVWSTGGEVARLVPTCDRTPPGAPLSLILKRPAPSEASRAQMRLVKAYRTEVRFYRDIAPTIDLRVPRCYFSHIDDDGDDFVLLLEDLSGLDQADQLDGVSVERAVLASANVARLHARYWQAADALDWIPPHNDPDLVPLMVAALHAGWPIFVDRFGAQLQPGALRLGERLADGLEPLMHASSREPVTVIHGDYRADNLLFGEAGGQNSVVVVDWQMTRKARPAYDLAFFLCESVTPSDRRACEERCLRDWHEELTRLGVSGYSFDDAREDYRRGVLVCLSICVMAATFMDAEDERGRAHLRAIVDRSFAAALDLGTEPIIPA